jgi:hypothetical protein
MSRHMIRTIKSAILATAVFCANVAIPFCRVVMAHAATTTAVAAAPGAGDINWG